MKPKCKHLRWIKTYGGYCCLSCGKEVLAIPWTWANRLVREVDTP